MSKLNSIFLHYIAVLIVLLCTEFLFLLIFRWFYFSNTIDWLVFFIEFTVIALLTYTAGHYYAQRIWLREQKTFNRMMAVRKEKLTYLSALDQLKNKLLSMNSIELISNTIIEFIKELIHVDTVKIYLWEDSEGFFVPHPSYLREDNSKFYVFDPFLLWITDNDRIFSLKDFDEAKYSPIKKDALSFCEKTNGDLIIPLTINNSLLGIITISGTKTKTEFSQDELEKLYEIKSVSVMSISNATFYSRLINLTENLELKVQERTRALEETQAQLIMSEKMASLGVMVAGIAHEINTPAGVINGSADNLSQNTEYIFNYLPEIANILNDTELRSKVFSILNTIQNTENRSFIDVKIKLAFKKRFNEKVSNTNISSSVASEITNFILDNHLQEYEDTLLELIDKGGTSLLKFLQNITLLYINQKNIKFAIKNIVRIIRALKYYSHLDQASYAQADVTEGIENTLVILNNQLKHGIEVVRNYQAVPKIYCNLDELNQVWTNIIQNAIQAMKGKGQLSISIYPKEDKIHIEITDNGPGIPSKIIDRIWDPFFTTKDQGEGSGLGLGIVRGIIDKHKGYITANSQPGNTIFSIILPINHQ